MIRELTKDDLNDTFFDLYYEGFLYHYNNRKDIFKFKLLGFFFDDFKDFFNSFV